MFNIYLYIYINSYLEYILRQKYWLVCYFCCLLDYLLLVAVLAPDISIIFLQGEIGRRSGGDNVLEREGYAVSAGFSLGLVALGMYCYSCVHLLEFISTLHFPNMFIFSLCFFLQNF